MATNLDRRTISIEDTLPDEEDTEVDVEVHEDTSGETEVDVEVHEDTREEAEGVDSGDMTPQQTPSSPSILQTCQQSLDSLGLLAERPPGASRPSDLDSVQEYLDRLGLTQEQPNTNVGGYEAGDEETDNRAPVLDPHHIYGRSLPLPPPRLHRPDPTLHGPLSVWANSINRPRAPSTDSEGGEVNVEEEESEARCQADLEPSASRPQDSTAPSAPSPDAVDMPLAPVPTRVPIGNN